MATIGSASVGSSSLGSASIGSASLEGGTVPVLAFSSTWKTDNVGTSTDTQIILPLESGGTYNFDVDWGDGSSDTITVWNQAEVTHEYGVGNEGTYVVTITGTIEGFVFNNGGDKDKLLNISQFGELRLGNSGSYFYGCSNLTVTATDILDLTGTTSLFSAFRSCTSLTTVPSITSWTTSSVTNFESIFRDSTSYDQDLDSLDVSGANNISNFFRGATSFNGAVGSWSTASVSFALGVFWDATSFDKPLNSWSVSGFTNMNSIFRNASSFNQPLGSWSLSSLGSIRGVFQDATSFNQPLDNWITPSITNALSAFNGASSFDQDLSSWDVSSVTNMTDMLLGSAFSRTNYDPTLIAWDALTLQSGVSFHAGTAQYSAGAAETARANMISSDSWTITDGGLFITFVSSWKTDNVGTSTDTQITLPLESGGTYNFDVDWGDGNSDTITAWNQAEVTHEYGVGNEGTYVVTISGTIDGWRFNNGGDKLKLLSISKFGDLRLGNSDGNFFGCSNLVITATDVLDTDSKSNWQSCFRSCSSLTTVPSMNSWDMSSATNMNFMFFAASSFNQPIGSWTTTSLTSMSEAFRLASSFNQSLNSWDVSGVSSFTSLFEDATNFNGDISGWTTTSLTTLEKTFRNAIFFNQNISGWDVSGVTSLVRTFNNASNFNQDISSWAVSGVGSFSETFAGATVFNQPLNSWVTTSASNLNNTFNGASAFNQSLSSWDVSGVSTMINTFFNASTFDQSLAGWDVSSVTNMTEMLRLSAFSQTSYDPTLIAWDALTLQSSVPFHAGTAQYGVGAPTTARGNIVSGDSWTITDGGQAP